MARLLVVDDEEQIRNMLKQMLEGEGYKVYIAKDGLEALDICRKNYIDLVITDIVMPKKEGVETIIDLKSDFPHVKIIAISGGYIIGPKRYLGMAESFGADRIFKKPVDDTEMLAAITELLSESKETVQ